MRRVSSQDIWKEEKKKWSNQQKTGPSSSLVRPQRIEAQYRPVLLLLLLLLVPFWTGQTAAWLSTDDRSDMTNEWRDVKDIKEQATKNRRVVWPWDRPAANWLACDKPLWPVIPLVGSFSAMISCQFIISQKKRIYFFFVKMSASIARVATADRVCVCVSMRVALPCSPVTPGPLPVRGGPIGKPASKFSSRFIGGRDPIGQVSARFREHFSTRARSTGDWSDSVYIGTMTTTTTTRFTDSHRIAAPSSTRLVPKQQIECIAWQERWWDFIKGRWGAISLVHLSNDQLPAGQVLGDDPWILLIRQCLLKCLSKQNNRFRCVAKWMAQFVAKGSYQSSGVKQIDTFLWISISNQRNLDWSRIVQLVLVLVQISAR